MTDQSRISEIHRAGSIASKAAELVGGPRAASHGDKLINHRKIAEVWNGILVAADKRPMTPLDAHDVANLMEGLKIARRYCGEFNADDYIDGAGYAACAGEIRAKTEEERCVTETWVAAALEGCPSGDPTSIFTDGRPKPKPLSYAINIEEPARIKINTATFSKSFEGRE